MQHYRTYWLNLSDVEVYHISNNFGKRLHIPEPNSNKYEIKYRFSEILNNCRQNI